MSLLGSFMGGKKTAGSDAGNALNLNAKDAELAQGQLGNLLNYQGNARVLDPIQGSRTATEEVQNNGILGQIFGQGGAMQRANAEEQDLASRGYGLQKQDHEAYGQGSDQIAREFGASEGNLAQALANRGMSSSGMAGQSFAGLQGNKMEQLGNLQRKISDDRMKSNMARLSDTRNFLSGLASQGANDINAQNSRQLAGEDARFGQLMSKNSAAQSRLSAMQQQGNEQMKQRAGTQETPGWAQGLNDLGGMAEQAGMAYATGGLSGASQGGGLGAPTGNQKKQGPNGMAGTW